MLNVDQAMAFGVGKSATTLAAAVEKEFGRAHCPRISSKICGYRSWMPSRTNLDLFPGGRTAVVDPDRHRGTAGLGGTDAVCLRLYRIRRSRPGKTRPRHLLSCPTGSGVQRIRGGDDR